MNAIVATPNAIYLGGNFSHVGPYTGPGAAIDAKTGRNEQWPMVAREPEQSSKPRVMDSAPDGSGGFYVAGTFTRVGGKPLAYLVHLRADGAIDRHFKPNPNDLVQAVAVSGSTVYAVGDFTTIGGEHRENLAALDASTGAATDWNPSAAGAPDLRLLALAVSGSTVYVAGGFHQLGGKHREGIAALNASTGAVKAWNPDTYAYRSIHALAVSGSTVYAGGSFGDGLVAIDRSSGDLVALPAADGPVTDLALAGSTLYTGGLFSTVDGKPRRDVAAINTETRQLTGWRPRPGPGPVNGFATHVSLAVSGSNVYVGGPFTEIDGKPRDHLAALDRGTGAPTNWNPDVDSGPETLSVSGSTVYAGGDFSSVGGRARASLAALDPATGRLKSWNPSVNEGQQIDVSHGVEALAVRGPTVYVGGDFNEVGGKPRSNLAAVDATTGQPTSWNPGTNRTVWALAASPSAIYAGGEFTTIGGESRSRIAALDPTSGAVTDWDPNATTTKHYPEFNQSYPYHRCFIEADPVSCPYSLVDAIAVSGSRVYVGGWFDHIGGKPRDNLAALNRGSGSAKGWNPDASGIVSALDVSGGLVYVGGDFGEVGGEPRASLAALSRATGAATDWDPSLSNSYVRSVRAIAVAGPDVYVGGEFNQIGGVNRGGLAGVDASSGAVTSWDPGSVFQVNLNASFPYGATSLALGPDGSLWVGDALWKADLSSAGVARFEP